ncbi:uncharacterized protein LOC111040728 [Myzus persicae]|uniref:uncharacterized protein LOC111040728 n=1 Tax=Myzus persicae TaxID=13164 RepID=UPI000B930995|nr:uncharacterized protein LOC111040728 [Myzus persicae]
MAPKSLQVQNRNKSSKNNIFIKKLNHALVINNNLRKRIEELSEQNKQLSTTRNNLSLEKMSLQTENNSIKNSNVQLTAMHHIMNKKINALEQTIQSCIPALVTMSQCIPSMLESVHEMSKFEIKDFTKEKKEKQTKTVRPMINGHTITQPAVSIRRFDMSPIIESPSTEQTRRSTEQTPKRPRKLSYRSSPQCKLNMEPYVRLKDVAAMLKNSKAVPNEEGSQRRLNENLGEGPSWLHTPENQTQNSNNSTNAIQTVESSPRSTTVNESQADVTTIASTSSVNADNTLNGTEERHSDSVISIDSSMMRNVTCRRRTKRSSDSSGTSDFDDSTSSSRPSRSASKNINYKEKSLGNKLRR